MGAACLIPLLGCATEPLVSCGGQDDTRHVQSALDRAAASDHGGVEIGAHQRCVVRSDLKVPAGIFLRGRPGAGIVAAPSARFARGLLVAESGDVTVQDLELVPGEHATAALHFTSSSQAGNFRVERVRVVSAATLDASQALVEFDCRGTAGACAQVRELEVSCDRTLPSSGTAVVGWGPDRMTSSIALREIEIRGCSRGIRVEGLETLLRDSRVQVQGAPAVGVAVDGWGDLVDNVVGAQSLEPSRSGNTPQSTGVALRAGPGSRIRGNRITWSGGPGVGIEVGPNSRVASNFLRLAGPSPATGILAGPGSVVEGNLLRTPQAGMIAAHLMGRVVFANNHSAFARSQSGTHVLIEGSQNLVEGNSFNGGAWGVRPPILESTSKGGFINGARLVGNNMTWQVRGCAVLLTGWHAQANSCTWAGGDEDGAAFWVGSPTQRGGCSTHTLISGNTLHVRSPQASLIRFGATGKRCQGKTRDAQQHVLRCDTRESCPSGMPCARSQCLTVAIRENLLMGAAEVPIDIFRSAEETEVLPTLSEIEIANNTLALGADPPPLVGFSPALTAKDRRGVAVWGNGIPPESAGGEIVADFEP